MSDDYWDIMAENTLSYDELRELGLIPRAVEYDESNFDFDLDDLDL